MVPTGSMIPTIELQDRVIANKFIYRFDEPAPGEIVAAPRERHPKALATPEGRAAAWSALYAGAFLRLERPRRSRNGLGRPLPMLPSWDPTAFQGLL